MASDGLIWLCVKDNNSFIRKNKGAQTKRNGAIILSAEPGNLTSENTFKYSGIANSKVIKFSVEDTETAGKTDVKITLGCKKHKKKNAIAFAETPLRFKSYAGAQKCIASQTIGNHYRSDLIEAAMKKWSKLHSFRRVKEGIAKPLTQKKGRKA